MLPGFRTAVLDPKAVCDQSLVVLLWVCQWQESYLELWGSIRIRIYEK